MSRSYMSYDPEQRLLLPQDLREWLPEEHLALFVSDVVEQLDLKKITDWYERGDGRGYPPYHPVMMAKLLVYGYCTGRVSSRKIEKATWEDVAYRVLSGNQQPDHECFPAQGDELSAPDRDGDPPEEDSRGQGRPGSGG